jgi:hypothetical protein
MNPTEFERALLAAFRTEFEGDRLLRQPVTDIDLLAAIRDGIDWNPYRRFLTAIAYRMPNTCGELAQQWLLEVARG